MLLIISINLFAQNENDLNSLEDLLKDNPNNVLQDEIDYYINHQIDLSNTSIAELSQLPLINNISAKKIYTYLHNNQDINFNDLKLKCNLSDAQIAILQKCTYGNFTKRKHTKDNFEYRIRSQFQMNDSAKIDSSYKGSNLNLYQRLRFDYDNIELGTILDKDAGEMKINDFQAGYLKFKSSNLNVILGDYILEYGLGGVMWKGIGVKKSLDFTDNVFSIGKGAKSYLSSLDYRFFRGLSTSYLINLNENSSLKIDLSYSNIKRSANIDTTNNLVTSLYTLGLYRNDNEINKKNNLNEKMYASNIEFKISNLILGVNGINLNYDKEISNESSNLINNSKGSLFSLYSNLEHNNFDIYNEITSDKNMNLALKMGIHFQSSNTSNVIYYRSYARDFNSPFGSGFGEFTNFSNENGLYIGSKIEMNDKVELNFFLDLFNTQGNTYLFNTKVRGIDLAAEIKYSFDKNTKMKFRLISQEKTDGIIKDDFKSIFQKSKYSSRLDFQTKTKTFNFSSRIEYNFINFNGIKANESGFAGFIDLAYKLNETSLGARYSLFSTNSYESAIWQYESVAPGLGQSQLMYGEGYRFFVYCNIKAIDNVSFWIKYGIYETNIENESNIISIKKDNKLNIQLDFRF